MPSPDRIAWAVIGVSRHLPFEPSCLVQAVAASVMLTRRGYAPSLRVGVRPVDRRAPLAAHAWVVCAGKVLVGGDSRLADYGVLRRR